MIICSNSWFLSYKIAVQCWVVVLCFLIDEITYEKLHSFQEMCGKIVLMYALYPTKKSFTRWEYMPSHTFSFMFFQFEPNRSLELVVSCFLFKPKYQVLLPEFGCASYYDIGKSCLKFDKSKWLRVICILCQEQLTLMNIIRVKHEYLFDCDFYYFLFFRVENLFCPQKHMSLCKEFIIIITTLVSIVCRNWEISRDWVLQFKPR